ncbi:MAG: hypothetical protein FWB76_00170 [Oscillospiraceae bacterium]|nr:hypothetical protein [Oscillospiraceae bacterium]
MLHEQFMTWLAAPPGEPFAYLEGNISCTIIRVAKNADFDYLYYQRNHQSHSIQRGEDFQYVGIHCKADKQIYDADYSIRMLGDEQTLLRLGADRLQNRANEEICRAVQALVGNDRSKLKVQELTNERLKHDHALYEQYRAHADAREAFLADAGDEAFAYRCTTQLPNWTEESFLAYVLDPQDFVARAAADYAANHQERILYQFMCNSAKAKEYIAICGNPRHPAHSVKRIMQAVLDSPAKTVRVTIRKNGKELTVKADAHEFRRDCTSSYSTWRIAAADRREYERLFGYVDYKPQDIVRIEYGRAVLYEAEDVT